MLAIFIVSWQWGVLSLCFLREISSCALLYAGVLLLSSLINNFHSGKGRLCVMSSLTMSWILATSGLSQSFSHPHSTSSQAGMACHFLQRPSYYVLLCFWVFTHCMPYLECPNSLTNIYWMKKKNKCFGCCCFGHWTEIVAYQMFQINLHKYSYFQN